MDVTPKEGLDIIVSTIKYNLESAVRREPTAKRIVLGIYGKPGGGKTSTVIEAGKIVGSDAGFIDYIVSEMDLGEEWAKYFTRTMHTAQQDSVEITGLPWARDGEMVKLRPEILPAVGLCTFFLDELAKGKMSTINAASQLMLEYRAGPHRISPLTSIIWATNHRKDKSGDIELPAHTIDRSTVINYVLSRKGWVNDYAIPNGVDPVVTFFVEAMPDYWDKHDEGQLIHPSARSYERSSNIIKSGAFRGNSLRAMIEGSIGPAAGHALYAFMSLRDKLPNPNLVLAKPDEVRIPEDKQAQWAMMSSLCGCVEKKTMNGLRKFLARFDKEISNGRELSVMLVQSLWARDKKLLLTEAGVEMTAAYLEVITGDVR